MSKIENTNEQNDFFALWEISIDNYFSSLEKSTTQYNHALSNLILDYSKTWNNLMDLSIDVFKEYFFKTGNKSHLPSSFHKTIKEFDRDVSKSFESQKAILTATIDVARNNLKALNDNSASCANTNKNLIDSWVTINPKN